jgi:DNA-binding response OmpR family regulator
MEVLLVEEDDALAGPLVHDLERQGFSVRRVSRVQDVIDAVGSLHSDLVVLDLNVEGTNGAELCRVIHERSSAPLIILTDQADQADELVFSSHDADDFVLKPVGGPELATRLRVAAQRAQLAGVPFRRSEIGALVIDTRMHTVAVAGRSVSLTPKEFDILALLAADPGAVFSRDEIIERVWGPGWFGPTKTLDVHIAGIRRKLGHPAWVENARGIGFRVGRPELPDRAIDGDGTS